MVAKTYIPDAQEIVWLNFDPQSGHEQAGHRPALVLTPKEYNRRTGLMICCPLTTKIKHTPLEVPIPEGILKENSVVLIHQVKTVDFTARQVKFYAKIPYEVLNEVRQKLAAILQIETAT